MCTTDLFDLSVSIYVVGLRDLEMKYGVVTLICQHLQVVLWFVKTGLLPECSGNKHIYFYFRMETELTDYLTWPSNGPYQ